MLHIACGLVLAGIGIHAGATVIEVLAAVVIPIAGYYLNKRLTGSMFRRGPGRF
ncbi:MAG: hypothetical protein KDA27_19675 [Candidatus Eisenbacteria bacterium]|uniref:Uncharacterized protein n=1 Tax=Eiseniibacteriota bacterium TaxID=2212470 RepID=A0A956NFV2_UNCEI|nr:hypothetical protein [Candidatus Eisenbacteria bacterium]